MQIRFNRRRTRLTAVVMLFVWLLAVGMGMANACLANEDHARHGHLHHHGAAVADHLTAEPQHDEAAQQTSTAKVACQNFCAAGQTGVLKQQSHEPAPLDLGLVPAISWRLASLPPYRDSPWVVQRNPTLSPPPIIFRFMRLTI